MREMYDALSLSEGMLQNPHRFEEACKWVFLGYVRSRELEKAQAAA